MAALHSVPGRRISDLDVALAQAIEDDPLGRPCPPRLRRALMHAVFPGGARVRPRLCVAVGTACGLQADDPALVLLATSVELVHCASLAHDDLPCFDDADLRRGIPTVHAEFDQATAVLVGDGLLTLGFDVAARATQHRPLLGVSAVRVLLGATGVHGGLVAGQAWESESRVDVADYHRAKTAALFEAATVLGALAAGAPVAPFAYFGNALGMVYQLADDLSDRTGDAGVLGKRTGRDGTLGRPTAALGDPAFVRRRLDGAIAELLGAVPACPGREALRAETAAVCRMIAARCVATPPPGEELPAAPR